MNRLIFNILISLIYFIPTLVVSQDPPDISGIPVDPDTKKIKYQEVVQEKGDPGYLYKQAMLWFNYYYINPTSLFTVQDNINGKIAAIVMHPEVDGRRSFAYFNVFIFLVAEHHQIPVKYGQR